MPKRLPCQRRSLVLALALLLVLVAPGLLFGETPRAAAATCTTTIAPSDSAGDQLQEAIDGATNGDVICLQAGTYFAVNLIIRPDLRLTIRGAGQSQTVLDAEGNGRMFTVGTGARIQFAHLAITGGVADTSNGEQGGGIRNEGSRLTLAAVTVTGNRAVLGGGITNLDGSTLILDVGTRVSGNRASQRGGGIYNVGSSTVYFKGDAQVRGNTAKEVGGGIYNTAGIVTLNGDAQVRGNAAVLQHGGGIANVDGGTVTLNDRAQVSGNQAGSRGGGVYTGAFVILNDHAQVSKNTAGTTGGGIYNNAGRVSRHDNAQVTGNTPDNCARCGE